MPPPPTPPSRRSTGPSTSGGANDTTSGNGTNASIPTIINCGGTGPPPPAPPARLQSKLNSICPVFSTTSLSAWLNHYSALGFKTVRWGAENYGRTNYYVPDTYGYAELDGVQIHVSTAITTINGQVVATAMMPGTAYLYVEDADEVYRVWSQVRTGRGNEAPVDTEYGLREGVHFDCDGNCLRYASPLENGKGKSKGSEGVKNKS
ncbi:hypothetical protein QBC35DRAFT_392081 [Podospora australis]|uniref:Uncharacterized protein n=1 Tax=Podospora australis TaxID=1536484 RepID=A0AAN6WMX2_9PEZI|nr:hypothetical protein QBC35DRAFT_392081 [Podospora australis]